MAKESSAEDPGPMPSAVREELEGLKAALDLAVPAKSLDRNLLIGTWNIRAFGDLSDTWAATEKDQPKRDLRALALITEIVRHFDVMAIQEVKSNLRAIRHMMRALAPDWSFVLTDVTRGDPGNDERLAFVFDTRRVKMSGLACELVLPEEELGIAGVNAMVRQFARTPYAVSFLSGGRTFILVTLHVLWGKVPADRLPELKAIADWTRTWAGEIASWGHNLIALGDFNIDRHGDAAFEAFTSSGLHPPDALNQAPRTIFAGKEGGFYDQIAWFDGSDGTPLLTLRFTGRAGCFDFVPHTFAGLDLQALSWRMSDHLPLWCEFSVGETPPVSSPPPARSPSPRGRRPRR